MPTPQSPNVSLVDPTVVSDLKEENSRLKAENDEMNHLSHSHRLEITELKNSMEEKEDELASYRESLRQANEEIKVLNLEVDDEEPAVDVAPKGNSLFSEVEDRRHIAEEKLKKVQSKSQEFKALYERKALELNKLRMQNVHLMNMSASSNGAKYEQNHVDRLYTLLQAEKDKNKDLTARLSNESGGDNGEFVKNLMRQSAADGEMLRDFTKQCANLESQMTRLKAQNFTLQMRLDEKLPAKKTSHARKNQEFVVEKVVFETKTEDKKESDEQPKTTSEYKPLESVKQPLEDSTNSTNETTDSGKPPKKKVMFNVAETSAENETDKPKRKVPRIPRESTNEVLDAEEECKKMNEQCNQQ